MFENKVLNFCVYIGAWLVVLVIAGRLNQFNQQTLAKSRRYFILTQQFTILMGLVLIFLPIWFLAKDKGGELLKSLFLVSEGGFLFAALLLWLNGQSGEKIVSNLTAVTVEYTVRNSFYSCTVMLLSSLISFAMPVLFGLVYFGGIQAPNGDVDRMIFQLATIGSLLPGMLFLMPISMGQMMSPSLDAQTRRYLMYTQLGNVIFNGVLLTAIMQTFPDIKDATRTIAISGREFEVPIYASLAALVYFLVFFFGPYLLGQTRSRSQRVKFLEEERRYLSRMKAALGIPAPDLCKQKLMEISHELRARASEIAARDKWIRMAIAQNDTPEESNVYGAPVKRALEITLQEDPRVRHLRELHNLSSEVATVSQKLTEYTGDSYLLRVNQYVSSCDTRMDEHQEMVAVAKSEGTGKVAAVITALLGIIGSQVVTWVGQQLVDNFVK